MRQCCFAVPLLLAAGCHVILPLGPAPQGDGSADGRADRGAADSHALDLRLDPRPDHGVLTQLSVDPGCNGGHWVHDGLNLDESKVRDRGTGVAFDAKGRFVVLGTLNAEAFLHGDAINQDIVLWRHLTDGTVDTSFATGGRLTIDIKNCDFSSDVVSLEGGKVLVGGNVDGQVDGKSILNDNPTVWQLDEDGSPDPSFSGNGVARVYVPGEVQGTGIAVSGDGYYLLGSQSQNWFAVGRLTTAGALDTAFAGDGTVVFNTVPGSYGAAVAVAPEGKVVVVGSAHPDGSTADSDMALWRFMPDGTLDPSFGSGGYLLHDGAAGQPGSEDQGLGLVIDPAGDIYVVGLSHNGTDNDLALWKVRGADGTLDPTFGTGGYRVHHGAAGGDGSDDGRAAILDGGKLLVVGASQSAARGMEMTIWRFTTDGALDTTLNGTGHYSHGREHADRGAAIAVRGSRVAVVGTTNNGTDDDLAVWCLTRTP